ncbi:hypothetical protein D3C71_1276760 [compost metagenome]
MLVDDLVQIKRLGGLPLLGGGLVQFQLRGQVPHHLLGTDRTFAFLLQHLVGNDVLSVPRQHDGLALLLGSGGGCPLLLYPALTGAGRCTAGIALGFAAGGIGRGVIRGRFLVGADGGVLPTDQSGQIVVRHAEGVAQDCIEVVDGVARRGVRGHLFLLLVLG